MKSCCSYFEKGDKTSKCNECGKICCEYCSSKCENYLTCENNTKLYRQNIYAFPIYCEMYCLKDCENCFGKYCKKCILNEICIDC